MIEEGVRHKILHTLVTPLTITDYVTPRPNTHSAKKDFNLLMSIGLNEVFSVMRLVKICS